MKRHGRTSKRALVWAVLDAEGLVPIQELAERTGCSRGTAGAYRRGWEVRNGKERKQREPNGGCTRCGVLGWERNPVVKGKCLWCRAREVGLDVRELCEAGIWAQVLELVERFPGRVDEILPPARES